MLPADIDSRSKLLEDVRLTVSAAGDLDEEQVKRLARVETLFAIPARRSSAGSRSRKGRH
jgi:hypothetical protein